MTRQAEMPVLIGCGQLTDRRPPQEAATPVQLMAEAVRKAAVDAGPGEGLLQSVDLLLALALTVDSPEPSVAGMPRYRNVPRAVAAALDIEPENLQYTASGGNTPQMMVNRCAQEIAEGRRQMVVITGAEALDGMIGRLMQGLDLDEWQGGEGEPPEMASVDRLPQTPHEEAHGIGLPAAVYPLFENALRGKYGEDIPRHQQKMGELFEGYCAVAVENPLSWFDTARTAEEISQPGPKNRYVGFPYTKYLNSVIQVNMGAALIMTSASRARELGVAEDRMVYLHGCADGNDRWCLHERADYCSSPAIRTLGQKALAMAGKDIDDMDYFDIYSCFPSAVQIACDELGIAHDDPRGLTVTGGLPYFGGPGNNYVTHAIASMMQRLRDNPGSFGLLNANGWYITKHSLGIYSTTPPQGPWQREDPAQYQQQILDQQVPAFTESPDGPATVETYTVIHGREGPERGLVIGRLEDGTRFVANTPADADTLDKMVDSEMLGRRGTVSSEAGLNTFVPEFD